MAPVVLSTADGATGADDRKGQEGREYDTMRMTRCSTKTRRCSLSSDLMMRA